MNILLKVTRNGLGAVIAFSSWIIPTKKVVRSAEAQQEVDAQTKNLELYQFFGCPFCIKIRRHIKRLNLTIVTRDAQSDAQYRDELLAHGGKIQVPCLKITKGAEVTWMYESNEIITYLDKHFN